MQVDREGLRGAKNKRTREIEAAMIAVAVKFAETVPDGFEGDGVAFLQTVYKTPPLQLQVRSDTAAKAARFERLMLSASNLRVIRGIRALGAAGRAGAEASATDLAGRPLEEPGARRQAAGEPTTRGRCDTWSRPLCRRGHRAGRAQLRRPRTPNKCVTVYGVA